MPCPCNGGPCDSTTGRCIECLYVLNVLFFCMEWIYLISFSFYTVEILKVGNVSDAKAVIGVTFKVVANYVIVMKLEV